MKDIFRNILLTVLAGFALLVLNGCATTGPAYTSVESVPADKALVYIYRKPSFVGGGVYFDIHDGDQVVTTLRNGGYFPYIRDPGEVELWAKTESRSSVTLDLKPGDIQYVKGEVGIGFLVGRPTLSVVDSATGAEEIKECKLLEAGEH